MPAGRPLPQNADAEASVLGGVLLNPRAALNQVVELLTPDDFYVPAHRDIFTAMLQLEQQHQPIDLITLEEQLREIHAQMEERSYLEEGSRFELLRDGAPASEAVSVPRSEAGSPRPDQVLTVRLHPRSHADLTVTVEVPPAELWMGSHPSRRCLGAVYDMPPPGAVRRAVDGHPPFRPVDGHAAGA